MRTFSAAVKQLLASDNPSSFFLVKLVTPSITIRDTTAPYDITTSAGTFSASSGLAAVEPPRLSDTVDKEAYRVVYADPEFDKLALFESGITGSILTVWVGMYNTSGSVLNSIAPGLPLTADADLIVAYKGTVDTQVFTINPEDGTVAAILEASSPVSDLGRINAIYTSKEAMKQINTADTSFDEVYIGSVKVALLWGKASVK